MAVDGLFAGVAVTDLDAAVTWYGQLFGHPFDVEVNADEVMWRVTDTGWVYVLRDKERPGRRWPPSRWVISTPGSGS